MRICLQNLKVIESENSIQFYISFRKRNDRIEPDHEKIDTEIYAVCSREMRPEFPNTTLVVQMKDFFTIYWA